MNIINAMGISKIVGRPLAFVLSNLEAPFDLYIMLIKGKKEKITPVTMSASPEKNAKSVVVMPSLLWCWVETIPRWTRGL